MACFNKIMIVIAASRRLIKRRKKDNDINQKNDGEAISRNFVTSSHYKSVKKLLLIRIERFWQKNYGIWSIINSHRSLRVKKNKSSQTLNSDLDLIPMSGIYSPDYS